MSSCYNYELLNLKLGSKESCFIFYHTCREMNISHLLQKFCICFTNRNDHLFSFCKTLWRSEGLGYKLWIYKYYNLVKLNRLRRCEKIYQHYCIYTQHFKTLFKKYNANWTSKSCWIWVEHTVVLASDVTPTERWLNVWCIWHTKVETLQEFQSCRQIGWIIQDFQLTCVTHSLTFPLETKMAWCQTPSRKKKAVMFTTVTTNAYQDQINRFRFKVRGIESFKYVREFYTPVCYCGEISMLQNVMLNETNCDWMFDMSVKWPHGRALDNESYHRFQTFSRQSEGLATRD